MAQILGWLDKQSLQITGKSLTLRLVSLDDANEKYLSWLNDPEVNVFLETRFEIQNLERIRTFIEKVNRGTNEVLFAILLREKLEHIGNIKIGPINEHHQSAELSYFIGEKSNWGKGFATEAIALCAKFGFEKLSLEKLEAGCYASNIGSQRALEKAGFTLEGRLKDKLLGANGVREDHLWYGITRAEHGQ